MTLSSAMKNGATMPQDMWSVAKVPSITDRLFFAQRTEGSMTYTSINYHILTTVIFIIQLNAQHNACSSVQAV